MSIRTVTWMPLALAAGFAGLTFWLGQVGRLMLPTETGEPGHVPDYIVENFKASAFDENGRLRHVLMAKKMTHYLDDDTAGLDAPSYVQSAPGQPALTVTSKRAEVSPAGSDVYFIDRVRMVRAAWEGRPEMVLTTEYLRVTPDVRRLQTDQGVTVRQAGSSIQAGAMLAEGRQQTVLFSRGVRSVYETP